MNLVERQAEEYIRRIRTLEAAIADLHRAERAHKNYGCRVVRSTNQTVLNTTWTYVAFPTDDWDPWDMHQTVLNTSRVTPGAAGPYLIISRGLFEVSSAGIRLAHLRINGSTVIGRSGPFPANGTYPTTATAIAQYYFDSDDYVEFGVWQSTGGNLYLTEADLSVHLLT